MQTDSRSLSWLMAAVFSASLVGCNTVPAAKFQDTQRRLQAAQEQNQQLQYRLNDQEATIQNLQGQVAELRGQTPQTFDELVFPVKIQLVKPSGGYDDDRKPGDEGLVLYVQPVDRDGHVVKAAGSLKVALYDLAAAPNRNLVAQYDFDATAVRKMWYGRLATHHFTVRCAWPPGKVPLHEELTAHVSFTDLLSGRTLSTQEAYKITLPPNVASR